MEPKPFSGAMTAIVTPFHDDNSIDLDCFKRLIDLQKSNGIDGVVVAGTTGESPALSLDEKKQLVAAALAAQDDSFSVYVGTGTNATASTIECTRELTAVQQNGQSVRGAMAVAPYYNKPNQAGMAWHFSELARAVPQTPLCLYNVPGRTASEIKPETVAQLAKEHTNIVALKEAAGQSTAMTALRLALRKASLEREFILLSGDDASYPAALLAGAQGVISVTSHVIPRTIADILKAAQSGEFERLRALNTAAFPLAVGLFCAPNPVPVKYALSLKGYCGTRVRGPLVELSDSERQIVESSLASSSELGAVLV